MKNSPFPAPCFVQMKLMSIKTDHVLASVDGNIDEYAIGHLPLIIQNLIRPPDILSATLACGQKRTILGILSDKAIEDVHDQDPLVCPISLNIIRQYSPDPWHTIQSYMQVAMHITRVQGEETSKNGNQIKYESVERLLTVEMTANGWGLAKDILSLNTRIPQTLSVASIGKPLHAVVEHDVFHGVDAIIASVKNSTSGTEIRFNTRPLKLRNLKETDFQEKDF